MSVKKCTFPHGIIFRPDGMNELDPCIYEEQERHTNVTVVISRCKVCGAVDISWIRQENTDEE